MVAICEACAVTAHGSSYSEKSRSRRENGHETNRVPSLAASSTPHVRIAENLEELLAAYRLVYRRYAERGLGRREPGGILYSSEFGEGDSRTLVAVNADGELNATATF